jgi:molybdate transport system permease protein
MAFCLVAAGWPGASEPLAAQGEPETSDDGSLLVLAAASLTDVLPALAEAWEEAGGRPVRFSFAATSRLARQVDQGSPGDVFVSADREWMDWVEERGWIVPASRTAVVANRLVVAVPVGRPGPLAGPADMVNPVAVARIGIADANAPAGRYARQALEWAGVWEALEDRVVRGGSVRGTLEWIARGEADAGIVYSTDAAVESRVTVAFPLPPESHQDVVYSAAVLRTSTRAAEAGDFVAFMAGERAEEIFADAGFRPAGAPFGQEAGAVESRAPDPWSAIRLSVVVALAATLVGLAPAVAVGWLLARKEFVGKSLLATLVLVPLVLPPVVTGFLLLSLLGSQSVLGAWLARLGVQVPFTLLGATVAALVVGLPLYIMAIRGAFQAVDARYEEVSWTLGVHRAETFRRVTLPLAIPGIAAGAVLAFARALGEFGATIVLAGNVEGSTQTIALAVYSLLESPAGHRATWMLVGASVAISLVALLGFEALTRRQRARLEDHRG